MIALNIRAIFGIAVVVFLILLAPPIALISIGFGIKKNNPIASKILFILAGLYLIVGLGFCGMILKQ